MKNTDRRRQAKVVEAEVSYRKAIWSAVAIVALTSFGVLYIGWGSGTRLISVRGKVTIDGQPLKKGLVIFYPNEKKGNLGKEEPRGKIGGGGYELFSRGGPGAAAGWYRVCVVAVEHRDAQSGVHGQPLPVIEAKYFDPKISPLEVEVRSDAPEGAYDLAVKSIPKRGRKA